MCISEHTMKPPSIFPVASFAAECVVFWPDAFLAVSHVAYVDRQTLKFVGFLKPHLEKSITAIMKSV